MRFFNIYAVIIPMFFVMKTAAQATESATFYGETFNINQKENAVSQLYEALGSRDSLKTQLSGTVKEVCQAKGCWMKVVLENSDEIFVKFKDYGFFVPTDSVDKNVVMNGIVFTEEISIEEQKHYARDRGDAPDELAKIDSPKRMLRFEADGVMIKDGN